MITVNKIFNQKCSFSSSFLLKILFLIIFTNYVKALSKSTGYDPYQVLGLSRSSATALGIRAAYKQLAKEWHPDKNPDPLANDKFVQINKAYELLSDPERRRLYDQKGIYDDTPTSSREEYHTFHRFDPIDEILTFSTGGSFHFPFTDGINFIHKQSITAKTFDQTTLPRSHTIPQLLIFYGDYCTGCARAAPAWRGISDELQSIGMDVGSVHADKERAVAIRIGISAVPAVILIIDSHPYHYRESVISAVRVINFVRSKLPLDLMTHLEEKNVDDFLNSWHKDNRIRIIIFGTLPTIRLRFLLLAFQFRERAAFGFINSNIDENEELCQRFGVSKGIDSILLFKESNKPVASLSMADLPTKLMKDLVENNKFLILPRLSNQKMMDTICPTESSIYRRRLCVVLITKEGLSEQANRDGLREFAQKPEYSPLRVRFAYIFEEKQHEFISALLESGNNLLKPKSPVKQNLVIIWRQDKKKLSFEWVDGGWDGDQVNVSSQRLENTLQKLLTQRTALSYNIVEIKELKDEHAQSFVSKVLKKISITMDFIRSNVTRELVIQATSLVATILFIVAGGFIMSYLVRLEEESIMAKANAENLANQRQRATTTNSQSNSNTTQSASSSTGPTTSTYSQSPELKVHEMRGETYNGLVRLIKPGCRTLLLLLDADTKNALLTKFYRTVWPYRKNKSLQFGFMHVDRGGGLSWYKQLLLLSLSEQRNLTINPRNCVGTVLSLNGHRKYFCVFHATLPTNNKRSRNGYRNGGFLGMEDSDESDENSDLERGNQSGIDNNERPSSETSINGILFTNHLLDNLSNWLDRLFEGLTHRYQINYWPEFPIIK